MTGPSWIGLAWSSLPVAGALVLLAIRGLGQVRPLVVALARLVGQLLLLAVVLDWLFRQENPWIVGAIATVMLVASAQTVGSRLKGGVRLRAEAFSAMAIGTVLVMAVSIRAGLRLDPWYEPRVVIPMLGMILGNSVTGVALAAERLESDLRAERDRVELRLSLGATTRQAALPALRSAVRAALTPAINNMMIAGIVAIPGMATGQLLAGADVQSAIRYQILIYLGITGTVAISTLILLSLRLRRYFTADGQLRIDRLGDEPPGSSAPLPGGVQPVHWASPRRAHPRVRSAGVQPMLASLIALALILDDPKPKDDTLLAKPPEGAKVLFAIGQTTPLEGWVGRDGKAAPWTVENGRFAVKPGSGDIRTTEKFGDFRMHLEFNVPYMPKATGQGRGNSGVYLDGLYELQVLDSYGLKLQDNDCGAIYKHITPSVNACKPPLQWQTYDVTFHKAVTEGDKVVKKARVTVIQNGITIIDDKETDITPGGFGNKEGEPGPLLLQDHGNLVEYRNLWIVPM